MAGGRLHLLVSLDGALRIASIYDPLSSHSHGPVIRPHMQRHHVPYAEIWAGILVVGCNIPKLLGSVWVRGGLGPDS